MNTQIELKKLRFHVPDEQGKSKCHKMHVGSKHIVCPNLLVHGTSMQEVTEDKYLGDIISSDGKNSKNISARLSKGLGIITQILHMLDSVSLGEYYMEIAILFREALFVNGILTNAEVWYGFSDSEIQEFEDLDKHLLRKILQVPISTPEEALYLELGILPIGVMIKARRINYFHYLLTRDESEMLSQFFTTQWKMPCKGDWTETVKVNLEEFDIPCEFENLKCKSQESFKRSVKVKAQEYALHILTEKQEKHSKMDNLYYSEIKPQAYLTMETLNIDEIRNIFRWRTRMARFGENYKGGREFVMCPLCRKHFDNQNMSLDCEIMRSKMNIQCKMTDIYAETVTKETAKVLLQMMKLRETLLEND